MTVQLVAGELLALATPSAALLVLDPATGKTRRTLKIPSANHFKVLGDFLFVLHDVAVTVFAYPSMKRVGKLDAYRTSFEAALSPDGRFFVDSDDEEVYVHDTNNWRQIF